MYNSTFFLFMCSVISTGFMQESTGYNRFPSFENSLRPEWPLQAYEKPQVQRRKPCPHRRNNPAGEQWVPSFTLYKDVLKPQSLKDGNVDKTKVPDSSDIKGENAKKNNPVEHSLNKNTLEPNRRSNSFYPEYSIDQSLNEDYDCDIELDINGNPKFEYETGQPESLASKPFIEHKVIEMLRDCFKKNKKHEASHPNELFVGSRRSMSGSDNDNKANDDIKPKDNDNEQANENEKTTDSTEKLTDDNISNGVTVSETPSFTLRPGKLFDELQNPIKVTAIADFTKSRRTQAENTRVCYACSTATNPSCWEPDSRTTIKYCRKDQNCVTKSMGIKNSLTILRDCAKSCDESSVPGIEPKYSSCSVCHKDLCNSAAISTYNLAIVFLIMAIKCTF